MAWIYKLAQHTGYLGIAVFVCMSAPLGAQALPEDGDYLIKARHSDQCLNVLNSAQENGANVVQAEDCNISSSMWVLEKITSPRSATKLPFFTIRNKNSRKCLNVVGFGQEHGDNVVQATDCEITCSQWIIEPTSNRRYNYIVARHSDQCLHVANRSVENGAGVVQARECEVDNAQWKLGEIR